VKAVSPQEKVVPPQEKKKAEPLEEEKIAPPSQEAPTKKDEND